MEARFDPRLIDSVASGPHRDYASMFPRLDGIVGVHYLPNACPWSIPHVHLCPGGVDF